MKVGVVTLVILSPSTPLSDAVARVGVAGVPGVTVSIVTSQVLPRVH